MVIECDVIKLLNKKEPQLHHSVNHHTNNRESMGLSIYSIAMKGTSKDHRLHVKQQVVRYAQKHGIKPSARHYAIQRNTIRTWVRRYEEEGVTGLLDKRKGPKNIKHKTSELIEQQVIAIRT